MSGADGIATASALLCSVLWQVTVLVAAAAILAQCSRDAAARGAIWTAALVLTLVVPLASAVLPKYVWGLGRSTVLTSLSARSPVPPNAGDRRRQRESVAQHLAPRDGEADRRLRTGDSKSSLRSSTGTPAWWQILFVAIWGVGAAIGTVRLVRAWITTARLVRISRAVETPVPGHLLGAKAWRRPVAVHSLPALLSPFCWQFGRTILVLPAAVEGFPEDELEMVLRHELVHLRRQDPLWLFLERVAAVVHWYHPAVWWAVRQASKYREFACDDAAISEPALAAPYLRCIDRMVRAERFRPRPATAVLGLGWERKLLVLRVRRLTGSSATNSGAVRLGRSLLAATALLAVAAALVLVRVGRAPFAHHRSGWTAWPSYSARSLSALGLPVRDFELDAHRLDPRERAADHVLAHRRRTRDSKRAPDGDGQSGL